MKVAYWGSSRRSGVTCALTAIGLTAVLSYPFKITIFEDHYSKDGVLRYLFPRKWLYRVAEPVHGYGQGRYQEELHHMSRQRCADDYPVIELLEKGLYYVPQFTENADLYDYQFHCNLLPVLRKYSEIAFIDTRRGDALSSKMILEEADVVAVLLKQDMYEIQSFFQNYSSLIPKAFFIISDYHRKSKVNLARIISEFGFRKDCIGVIPHSDEFRFAADYGRMIEYISSNYMGGVGRENHYFMQELKKTTFMLMQQVAFNRELGEVY